MWYWVEAPLLVLGPNSCSTDRSNARAPDTSASCTDESPRVSGGRCDRGPVPFAACQLLKMSVPHRSRQTLVPCRCGRGCCSVTWMASLSATNSTLRRLRAEMFRPCRSCPRRPPSMTGLKISPRPIMCASSGRQTGARVAWGP